MRKNLNIIESKTLLANNYIGNLSYIFGGKPFIVPITYFFDSKNTLISYSAEGHKTKAMRKNNHVSLAVTEISDINNWSSVLAHGTFEELSGSDSKAYLRKFATGVKDLILRKEEKNLHFISEFSSKIYNDEIPVVFKITIDEITGKYRAN